MKEDEDIYMEVVDSSGSQLGRNSSLGRKIMSSREEFPLYSEVYQFIVSVLLF